MRTMSARRPARAAGGQDERMDDVLKVLLVEDDDVDRMAVRRALGAGAAGGPGDGGGDGGGARFAVEDADTVAGALERARAGGLDCVLLDHHLPDADGTALIRQLRAAGLRVPVVVLTGQGDEELAVQMMKAGASDYLVKGRATPEHLARSLRTAVRLNRAETRAESAGRARDEAVALLDTLVGQAPVGVAFLDNALRYVRVNAALAEINGVPADAHLGRTIPDVLPRQSPQVEQDLRRVLETGEPMVNVEVTGETPADPGAPHTWIASYYPVRSRGGTTLGVGAIVIDITERKRYQRELALAKEAAEAASRAKDQFLAVLSHELRTPLTPVLVTVQSLQEQLAGGRGPWAGAPRELRDALVMMRRNVELEARLIDDLLDLTRIARGKLQLHLEQSDAHALLEAAVEICRPEALARGLALEVDLEARRRHVFADPARLQQVFWNLINNAIKFTPPGGTLRVRTFDEDERLVVQVSDTGIGIEPDVLPRIFDAFEQGERSVTRRFGGLGLGLAICKALVRMHWGQICAESAGRGHGATFTVRLAGRTSPASIPGAPGYAPGEAGYPGAAPAGAVAGAGDGMAAPERAEGRPRGADPLTEGGGGPCEPALVAPDRAAPGAGAERPPTTRANRAPAGRVGIRQESIMSPEPKPSVPRAPSSTPGGLAPSDRLSRSGGPPSEAAAGLRILMVDDHEDTRTAMKLMLERSGYHVATADTVATALQAADADAVDILISDIGLPDGSGLEIMRHLRDRAPGGGGKAVRGIALSGFGMDDDVRRSREAGFDHHLTKPVNFERLRAVLRQFETQG